MQSEWHRVTILGDKCWFELKNGTQINPNGHYVPTHSASAFHLQTVFEWCVVKGNKVQLRFNQRKPALGIVTSALAPAEMRLLIANKEKDFTREQVLRMKPKMSPEHGLRLIGSATRLSLTARSAPAL